MSSVTLNLKSIIDKISDRDLAKLCQENPDARLEINAKGQLIIMPPTGSLTGDRNGELLFQIKLWNRQYKLGKVFDSSTGFQLSNTAIRSPDVSWINIKTWNSLSIEQQEKFAPIDPDFVLELMSPTDNLMEVQTKMNEYISCGVKLGWLIYPGNKQVEIYRKNRSKEVLDKPETLLGEDVMPNLTVDLTKIWN